MQICLVATTSVAAATTSVSTTTSTPSTVATAATVSTVAAATASVAAATTSVSAATTSVPTTASTTSTTVATASTATSPATTSFSGLGLVDLDLLAVDGGSVHLLDGALGLSFAAEGDKGEALAGVVDVCHLAALLELGAELAVLHVLVDAVDEQLAAVLAHGEDVCAIGRAHV